TYAAAIQHQLPITHATTMARESVKGRQMLIDVKSRTREDGTPLTELELVTKANLALDMMANEGEMVAPGGARFVSAQKLKNGGILYELSSKEVVTWLRLEKHLAAFTGKFGLEATVRARYYAVVWQGMPMSFVPSEQ
ncbi:uncharacterized protein B0H18DRAFT_849609, partial [Fomitopsis serialis]|uniref:uncharacterized protein n=1 Tax=Fomitopsis serialis TaxID=139415 RepID=UPI002008A48E